jgi:hypothetical protein
VNASRPPAEAPIPTIGKGCGRLLRWEILLFGFKAALRVWTRN